MTVKEKSGITVREVVWTIQPLKFDYLFMRLFIIVFLVIAILIVILILLLVFIIKVVSDVMAGQYDP